MGAHRLPVPVGARRLGVLGSLQRPRAGRVEPESRRQHEPLLRPGNHDIDAPLLLRQRHRRERGDGVDHEQRLVTGIVEHGSHRRDIGAHTGGGLVVDQEQRAVGRGGAITLQPRRRQLRVDRPAPVTRNALELEAQPRRDVAPAVGEEAVVEGQNAIPWRERVDQRRLPAAVAGGGKHEHLAVVVVEDRGEPVEDLSRQERELGAPMIDTRLRDGTQHSIRDVGRPRHLQEMSSSPVSHRQHLVRRF